MRNTVIRGTLAAMAAGGLAAAGLASAAPALALPIPGNVPCSAPALAYSIAHAYNGEELLLAQDCTYLLHSALPPVTVTLTLEGRNSTLQRSRFAPDFSLLTVNGGGGLTVANVNFRDGSGVRGGAIYGHLAPVTVLGGRFTSNYASLYGGAIYNGDGLSVNGASFISNSAYEYGGAIDSEDTATIENSTLNGNSTEYGAAVYSDDYLTLSDSAFAGNTASEYGGGVEVENTGVVTATLTGDTFTGNSAVYGGGIELESGILVANGGYFLRNHASYEGGGLADYGKATLYGTRFINNESDVYGGAIETDATWLNLYGYTITGNTAQQGGGIYNEAPGTLAGGTISGNSAVWGGGFYNDGGNPLIQHSTLQENTASTAGGGIYNGYLDTISLSDSRVVDNNAPAGEGGGIFNHGTVNLTRTLVAHNTLNNCSPAASVPGCFG